MRKTALITGITGQDGAYLAKFLLEKGYKVVGTVRSYATKSKYNFTYLGIKNDIIFEEVDLSDITNIFFLLKNYEFDEIYNLAAQSAVGLSFAQPIGTFSFNTISVCNLLEGIRLFSPKTKFYQASSSEMYGEVDNMPIDLNTPMHPISPYGVSKMAAYFLSTTYRESYNLFIANGVLFNHESHLRGDNFFVKKVIKSAIAIKRGHLGELRVGNLNVKRDFGYAPKYVEVMWRILQTEAPDDFIICSGQSLKLRSIVEYVFDYFRIDKKLIIEDEKLFRPNEIYNIYGDNSKAKKHLNWTYDYDFYDVLNIIIEEELNSGL
jgi:GDPmannose 4,6-dehydratase